MIMTRVVLQLPTEQERAAEFAFQIAERIRTARAAKSMTQEDFAKEFGCNDRQTISAIETGIQRVKPDEMVRIAKILAKPLSFFTDPYLITEPNSFSYRARPNSKDVDAFEKRAHKLISANRRFRKLLGEPESPFGNQLKGMNRQTPLAAAAVAGEKTAKSLGLGEIPALKLLDAAEEQLRVVILFIDAPESISGAACHLPDGDYILINRNEVSFRRNFNLGHELFHILTWAAMPPDRVDTIEQGQQRPKVEKLADNFSSGLLIPLESLQPRWKARQHTDEIHQWILTVAKEFRVSGEALYWRLINANLLSPTEEVNRAMLSRSEEDDRSGKPNPYNAEFVRRLHAVLEHGLVSTLKAAELLDCEPHDLKSIVTTYGLTPSF